MKWAHLAADGGNAEAMDFVGSAYLRGNIIERNPVIALGYFKAAAPESSQAAFNLGQCYFGAQGTEQDVPKALECWKKAADAGHGRAAARAAMAEENLYVLCNPAVATPGLQLITAADLKDFWRSDHYGALSKGVLSRPAFLIESQR